MGSPRIRWPAAAGLSPGEPDGGHYGLEHPGKFNVERAGHSTHSAGGPKARLRIRPLNLNRRDRHRWSFPDRMCRVRDLAAHRGICDIEGSVEIWASR